MSNRQPAIILDAHLHPGRTFAKRAPALSSREVHRISLFNSSDFTIPFWHFVINANTQNWCRIIACAFHKHQDNGKFTAPDLDRQSGKQRALSLMTLFSHSALKRGEEKYNCQKTCPRQCRSEFIDSKSLEKLV